MPATTSGDGQKAATVLGGRKPAESSKLVTVLRLPSETVRMMRAASFAERTARSGGLPHMVDPREPQ